MKRPLGTKRAQSSVEVQAKAILARLLAATAASRITLRIDDDRRGWHIDKPACEVLAKGVSSMQADTSIDHRAAATAQWLLGNGRTLVQPDLTRAADPAPPRGLTGAFAVKAQMLCPLFRGDGWLSGWISVHYLEVPGSITRSTVELLEAAACEVAQLIGLTPTRAPKAQGSLPHDPIGAFCRENHGALHGVAEGPLRGLTFAAKDLFDVKGALTGFGQPSWLASAQPARRTARAVQLLLDAGASLVAKAHCDELCYSLTGENAHYGTPENVNAPGRIPGGSSNGSAAAVAAGLVDFAIGSDCGGSVRKPASYCGIYGLRPTWDRVSLAGAVPFGPSFDVAGWFARDPELLERVGRVLLRRPVKPALPKRLLIASDAFSAVEPLVAEALEPAVAKISKVVPAIERVEVAPEGLDAWFDVFRTIQAYEVWQSVGAWVEEAQPALGPGVKERIAWARTVSPEACSRASRRRSAIRRRLRALLTPGDVLCLPTSPRIAPLRGTPTDQIEIEYRNQAMKLLCISGLCGLPQISLPIASHLGLPLGLSLIAPRDSDEVLLALARQL